MIKINGVSRINKSAYKPLTKRENESNSLLSPEDKPKLRENRSFSKKSGRRQKQLSFEEKQQKKVQFKSNKQEEAEEDEKQMRELLKLSDQISRFKKQYRLLKPWPIEEDVEIKKKFHTLFDLYLREEILKHYCSKFGWKFDRKLIDQIIYPALDLLATDKSKVSSLFDPYLRNIAKVYLLHTDLDTYSRLDSRLLLMEITGTWLKIKQAEINLKRSLRRQMTAFKKFFFYEPIEGSRPALNNKKFFHYMFSDDKVTIQMVNLIKVCIFYEKSMGESNERDFDQWVQQY